MADPLDVTCPDCGAPPGSDCGLCDYGYDYHADRLHTAELQALTHGTCGLCGQPMVSGTVAGVLDAWHPDPESAAVCPAMPDPKQDWNAYAMAINLGARAGHPGLEHFRPTTEETTP